MPLCPCANRMMKGKEEYMSVIYKEFREHNLRLEQIKAYRELWNQWSAAACLARVNGMLMLKYYERGQNFSFE